MIGRNLRGVRKLVDAVLAGMSRDFDGLYAKVGLMPGNWTIATST